jgi:hypothetical protein
MNGQQQQPQPPAARRVIRIDQTAIRLAQARKTELLARHRQQQQQQQEEQPNISLAAAKQQQSGDLIPSAPSTSSAVTAAAPHIQRPVNIALQRRLEMARNQIKVDGKVPTIPQSTRPAIPAHTLQLDRFRQKVFSIFFI